MILLVEDDEDVGELLRFTLDVNGYNAELVGDGAAALAVMASRRPCLVILDLVLPGMTGWQVLEQMQQRGLADIPVCVVSALSGPTPPAAVMALGKPFETRELLAVVDRYCPTRAAAPAEPA